MRRLNDIFDLPGKCRLSMERGALEVAVKYVADSKAFLERHSRGGGAQGQALTQVKLEMPPGCAYILTGAAQGATRVCERRCTGHKRCECCWTQGVRALPLE